MRNLFLTGLAALVLSTACLEEPTDVSHIRRRILKKYAQSEIVESIPKRQNLKVHVGTNVPVFLMDDYKSIMGLVKEKYADLGIDIEYENFRFSDDPGGDFGNGIGVGVVRDEIIDSYPLDFPLESGYRVSAVASRKSRMVYLGEGFYLGFIKEDRTAEIYADAIRDVLEKGANGDLNPQDEARYLKILSKLSSRKSSQHQAADVIVHEIGHILGLEHTPESEENCMAPLSNPHSICLFSETQKKKMRDNL